LLRQSGDLAALPAGILTERQQAVGKTVAIGMTSGRPLRSDMLRPPMAIQQGQSVRLVTRGAGFRVATEGRALNSATDGQLAQARVHSGQTLSGIARAGGVIEIAP
jgi:flagellar basal body P-ring formation protein FlgA